MTWFLTALVVIGLWMFLSGAVLIAACMVGGACQLVDDADV